VPAVQLGTAVLLPALRNPVVLAQQLATIDQLSEGRLVIGAGIAADAPAIRAEFLAAGVPFEKRVGRFLEGFRLCRALWSGEAVDWDGRWQLRQAQLAPLPYTPGGPPIWLAAAVQPGIERAAKYFDGWFPLGPDATEFGRRQQLFVHSAEQAGRDSAGLTTALYLTVAIADSEAEGDGAINDYLQNYYGMPPAAMRTIQACYGGPLEQVLAFIRSYVRQGAQHIVVRVVGDHEQTLQRLSERRDEIE
jgi:alkanesulfonate monooxygenase SsuD/methylene tetrahydromethanopterin reductase-like flavin-dependent oxidoreductase (luciferase family)